MGRTQWHRPCTTENGLRSGCHGVLCLCPWEYVRCEWVSRITLISECFSGLGQSVQHLKGQGPCWISVWQRKLCLWEECSDVKAGGSRCPCSKWMHNLVICCLLLFQQLAGIMWYFCLELCTDCPVTCIWEGFLKKDCIYGRKTTLLPFQFPSYPCPNEISCQKALTWYQFKKVPFKKHWHCSECWQNLAPQQAAAFSFTVANHLVERRVINLTVLWVLVLSKYSILALTAIPAAESLSQTLKTLYHCSFQSKSY